MKEKIRSFQATDTSLIGMIENSIKRNWKFPAYTDYGTSVTYTYRDVACKIKGLHLLFADLGINPGDRIAICDKNSSNWAISFLAVLTYGAVVVPILPDFSKEQIENIFEHSDSVLMIGRAREHSVRPMIDIETNSNMSTTAFCDSVQKFLLMVSEAYHQKPLVYTYQNFYNKYLQGKVDGYPLFIAKYTEPAPVLADGRDYILWQYTGKGRLNGFNTYVDKSRLMGRHSLREIRFKHW